MTQELLQFIHITVGVLTGAATALLAMMFWNSSLTNRDPFTTTFLQLLSMCSATKAFEIGTAMYRSSQIPAEAIPVHAALTGLAGRALEMCFYLIMVWFLLRPETKKALNGGSAQ